MIQFLDGIHEHPPRTTPNALCELCILLTQLITDLGKGPITATLYHVISHVQSHVNKLAGYLHSFPLVLTRCEERRADNQQV